MKYIITLIASLLLAAQVSFAKSYAYVYIEGDRQTPFYVKLEGQMLPRLGKNYCIIPNLDEGVTNIEVLFQQNKFPAQKFKIKVPAEGSRGFVLQKVNDRQFALYDIQQGIYLLAGNKAEDDSLPEAATTPAALPVKEVTAVPVASTQDKGERDETLPAFSPGKKTKKKPAAEPATEEPEEAKPSATDASRFIPDIELNTEGTAAVPADTRQTSRPSKKKKAAASTKKAVKVMPEEGSLAAISGDDEEGPEYTKEQARPATDQGIPNTDCKSPMSSDDFENFALKILDKADDDARLKALKKNKGRLCFTTEQVRIIANNLDTQSGRYEVTKMLYAQTSDQGNYPQLESLFKTPYLKGKFREILSPKP